MNRPAAPVCLLVDDEPLARARLRQMLLAAWPDARIREAGDTVTARQMISGGEPPSVVFLDIHMPGTTGLEWLSSLRQQPAGPGPAFVLVSADTRHALQAFELDVCDYLGKPVGRERLQQCLNKVGQWLLDPISTATAPESAAPSVLLQDRQHMRRIPLPEVLFWRAEDKALSIQTLHGLLVQDGSLQTWQDQLGDQVLRVHRNMLVNVGAMRQLKATLQGWMLMLQSPVGGVAHWVPVSRRQLPTVRQVLERDSLTST